MNRFNPKSRSPKRKKLQSCEVCENRGVFQFFLQKVLSRFHPLINAAERACNQPPCEAPTAHPLTQGEGLAFLAQLPHPASHAAAFSGIERQLLQCLLPEKKHCKLCLKRCTYRFCDRRLQHRSFFILLNLQINGKLQRKRHTRSFSNF